MADRCTPNPCAHGVCSRDGDGYRCACDPGWEGVHCDVGIDDCTPNPCAHGVCTNEVDGYRCACDPGWEGVHCDIGCGDGVVLGDEVCDGTALDGQTCRDHGFDGGTLACAADCLSVDTSDCTDFVVPPEWACDPNAYGAFTDCDCECGAYDPDCDNAQATVNNCLPGQTCNSGGHCTGALDCAQMPNDAHEMNESCTAASRLPDALENGSVVTVGSLTLHHPDASSDVDWFEIHLLEGPDVNCGAPLAEECDFGAAIIFTPPNGADPTHYQMCVTDGTCGGPEICTADTNWDASASSYVLSFDWSGTCALDDSRTFYVKLARSGGQYRCDEYFLQYWMTFSGGQRI